MRRKRHVPEAVPPPEQGGSLHPYLAGEGQCLDVQHNRSHIGRHLHRMFNDFLLIRTSRKGNEHQRVGSIIHVQVMPPLPMAIELQFHTKTTSRADLQAQSLHNRNGKRQCTSGQPVKGNPVEGLPGEVLTLTTKVEGAAVVPMDK